MARSLAEQMALLCPGFPGLDLALRRSNVCGCAGLSNKQKGQARGKEGYVLGGHLGQERRELGRLRACPLGRAQVWIPLALPGTWLGLKSGVSQGLGKIEAQERPQLWLHLSAPCPSCLSAAGTRGLAQPSLVVEQRGIHGPFVPWMKTWGNGIEGPQQLQGQTGTSTHWKAGWDIHVPFLMLCLQPSGVSHRVPSHHCGLCPGT